MPGTRHVLGPAKPDPMPGMTSYSAVIARLDRAIQYTPHYQ